MAIYRCEAKAISRGQGRSCVAAAAYRHADKLQDDRQQMTHSYERKKGVTHSEIIAPDNAPDWAQDRGRLWNHIDTAEKRKDAMTAREILVALPRELTLGQQVEAVRSFVRAEFTARGIIADVAIHEPDARDGEKQPHAHIMVSDRPLDAGQPTGLASKKDRTLAYSKGIEALRERWAEHCNTALERAGLGERVDHRSLANQRKAVLTLAADNTRPPAEREQATVWAAALDHLPEPKIGPVALQMERQGRGSEALALRDALEVREERGALARIVESWQQIRDQTAQLRQVIADRPRDPLAGYRAAIKRVRENGGGIELEQAETRLAVAQEYLKAGENPAHHGAAILAKADQRVIERLARAADGPSQPAAPAPEATSARPELTDTQFLSEWDKSRQGRAALIRQRADKLANKIHAQIDRLRGQRADRQGRHDATKPKEPGRLARLFGGGDYAEKLAAWTAEAGRLKDWCRPRETSLGRRLERLKGYLSRDHFPGYPNRADQKVERQMRVKHPELAERYDRLREQQKQERQRQTAERMQQKIARDRSRGGRSR